MINKITSGAKIPETIAPESEPKAIQQSETPTVEAAQQKAASGAAMKAESQLLGSLQQSRIQDQLKEKEFATTSGANLSETSKVSSALGVFRAAKSEGKVPWTDATVNRFMKTSMTPSDYPKAFDDFKGWVKTNFYLTSTQDSELHTLNDSSLSKLRLGADIAAKLKKPLEFAGEIKDLDSPGHKMITAGDPVPNDSAVKVPYVKGAAEKQAKTAEFSTLLKNEFAKIGIELDQSTLDSLATKIAKGGQTGIYAALGVLYGITKAYMASPPDVSGLTEIASGLAGSSEDTEAIAKQLISDPDLFPLPDNTIQLLQATRFPQSAQLISQLVGQGVEARINQSGFVPNKSTERGMQKIDELIPKLFQFLGSDPAETPLDKLFESAP